MSIVDLYKLILDNKNSIKQINISGGEPLISKVNYRFLNFLIDNNLTHIILAYSTNLSKIDYEGIDLVSLFEKFDNIIRFEKVKNFSKVV